MEYTKGNWNVYLAQPYDEHEFEVSYDTSDGLTYPIADIHKVEDGEAEANARLIAQAPKLYEALLELMEALEKHGSLHSDVRVAYNLAKPVIASVEGK